MSRTRKIIGAGIALTLVLAVTAGQLAVPAAADDNVDEESLAVTEAESDAAENTAKEEVIYVNLGADGSVSEVVVVNSFDDLNGEVLDYGEYDEIRNMTTTDEIVSADGCITIETDSETLYYEGVLNDAEIPWDIDISYFMDGTEYDADEIAGMSGELEIDISISENDECEGSFFDDYALQMSVTLDTDIAKNICADGATIASVGADRQLTYTILAGSGCDYVITADVTDFEMDAIAINAIKLNLDIEVDDEELMEMVSELSDAVSELNDGAGELSDGANELVAAVETLFDGTGELLDGADELNDGAAEAADGASQLSSGLGTLSDGVEAMQDALTELDANSDDLTDGSAQVLSALKQIESALSGVSASSSEISKLTSASGDILAGINELSDGIDELGGSVSFDAYKALMSGYGLDVDALAESNEAMIEYLSAINTDGTYTELISLLSGNVAAISGMESYLDAVEDAIAELADGASELESGYAEFDATINELAGTVSTLLYQMSTLKSAVETLVSEYETLDDGIESYTEGVAAILAAYGELSDGVSTVVSGSASLSSGTEALSSGTSVLLSGIRELYEGTGELSDGADELSDGAETLSDGTGEFYEETSGLDVTVSDKIDELLEAITGGDGDASSFVSDQNTEVDAVQFVIQTPAIEIAEAEEDAADEEESLNFWQKLLALFGI